MINAQYATHIVEHAAGVNTDAQAEPVLSTCPKCPSLGLKRQMSLSLNLGKNSACSHFGPKRPAPFLTFFEGDAPCAGARTLAFAVGEHTNSGEKTTTPCHAEAIGRSIWGRSPKRQMLRCALHDTTYMKDVTPHLVTTPCHAEAIGRSI